MPRSATPLRRGHLELSGGTQRITLPFFPDNRQRASGGDPIMMKVVYSVVEHDGGWAYKAGDVFSETFRSREDAHAAAEIAAQEQMRSGDSGPIEYQTEDGRWHTEGTSGDRPSTDVQD